MRVSAPVQLVFMVASSNKSDANSWLQTRCAKCQTVFEVPTQLLESSDKRVRCGECLSIFNALEGVERQQEFTRHGDSESDADSADSGAKQDLDTRQVEGFEEFSNLDVTYSDFDLFSNEAQLPEVSYREEPKERVEFNFDSVEIDHDQTFSDTLFVNDVTINADLPIERHESEIEKNEAKADVAHTLTSQANVEFADKPSNSSTEPLVFQYHDPDDTAEVEQTAADIIDTPDANVANVAGGDRPKRNLY